MAQYTIRTGPDPDLEERIEERLAESDRSKSATLRAICRRGIEAEGLETENDRLRKRLQALEARQRDVGELVEYVDDERSLRREQARRDRLRSEAGALTRFRYWALGLPSEADAGEE